MESLLPPPPSPPPEDRNRLILRRTLSVVAWLYSSWSLLLGVMILSAPRQGEGLYASANYGRLMVAHGILLGLSGWALWRPRRGAWALAALAGAGSIGFALADGLKSHWENAALDLVYPLVTGIIFAKAGPRAGPGA